MERATGRVEAFSDGVFAIAITLLVLEIRVPELEAGASSGQLFAALTHLWPSFVAFAFSFFVILIMWINHHEFLRWVREPDYPFLFANGLVLMMVTFVPFPTGVVARHLGSGAARGAVVFYCGTFLCTSLAYQALFLSVAHKRRLVRPEVTDEALRRVQRAYRLGLVAYGLSTALAFWNARLGLVVCAALCIMWMRLCYHPLGEARPGDYPQAGGIAAE
jgi:uncharacterized membrane protein